MSGYSASELVIIKLVGHPDLPVSAVHPGMVEPEQRRGIVVPPFLPFSKDKAGLTGGFAVCVSTMQGDFLKGGYIQDNWDVEELKKHKDEISEKKLIKLAFLNRQLQPGGHATGSSQIDRHRVDTGNVE